MVGVIFLVVEGCKDVLGGAKRVLVVVVKIMVVVIGRGEKEGTRKIREQEQKTC